MTACSTRPDDRDVDAEEPGESAEEGVERRRGNPHDDDGPAERAQRGNMQRKYVARHQRRGDVRDIQASRPVNRPAGRTDRQEDCASALSDRSNAAAVSAMPPRPKTPCRSWLPIRSTKKKPIGLAEARRIDRLVEGRAQAGAEIRPDQRHARARPRPAPRYAGATGSRRSRNLRSGTASISGTSRLMTRRGSGSGIRASVAHRPARDD